MSDTMMTVFVRLLHTYLCQTLENTEGAIKYGQSRENDNIQEEEKQNKNKTQSVLNKHK
jgi:hypothetical protein